MEFTQDSATAAAKSDLAARLNADENDIEQVSVVEKDFPDGALGAPAADEFAAMMISSGWQIRLAHAGEQYEYRADKYQLRLFGFNGENFVIV
jgi:hypothetical protein